MKSPKLWRNIPHGGQANGKEHKPKIVTRSKCDHVDSSVFIESWKMEKLQIFKGPGGGGGRGRETQDALAHIPRRR
jgi:hypothetical protein